jgi:hypothetical protein
LFQENAIFFLEVFNDSLLVSAHPAGDRDEQELELRRHRVENLSKVLVPQSSIWSRLNFLAVHGLGLWISLSAFFLYVCEQKLHDLQLAQDLDTLDGMVASELQEETVKFFEGKQPEEQQRSLEDTAGFPTGLAPDIHRQVELRRVKREQAGHDKAPGSPDSRT